MKYIKKYNENIDPFNEDEWDEPEIDDIKYWIGEISYDQIEVCPCNIDGNKIIRIPDNQLLYNFKYSSTRLSEDLEKDSVYINIPMLMNKQKLVYIYTNELDKDDIVKKMISILNNIQDFYGRRLSIRLIHQLNTHDECVHFSEDWKIVNII